MFKHLLSRYLPFFSPYWSKNNTKSPLDCDCQNLAKCSKEIYRQNFAEFIKNNTETYVLNSNREHAHIIISELIKSAKETLFIQCTSFDDFVYNEEIINKIKDCHRSGVDVRIAVRSKVSERQSKVRALFADVPDITLVLGVDSYENDFCVVDAKRLRIETDEHNKEAIAFAYRPELGENLANIFETHVPRIKQ